MRKLLLGFLLAACGDAPLNHGASDPAGDAVDTIAPAPPGAELMAEVTPPRPVDGRMVARTPVPELLGGSWRALATRCDEPHALHILAEGDSVDILIRINLPDSGSVTRRYSIVPRGATALFAGHARMGVQTIGALARSFEAVEGDVTLERLDQAVDGRFEVVIQDVRSWERIRYAGAFRRLPLTPEAAGPCPAAPDQSAQTEHASRA